MAKIAFIILCHKNAESVASWAETYVNSGSFAVIHFDKNGSDSEFEALKNRFSRNKNVVLVPRIKCGWGEWSLVKASLRCLKVAEKEFPRATHFFLTSGDCAPIKPAKYLSERLDQESKDYIENQDFVESGWIKTGMVKERLIYRHYFNERKYKRLFYGSLKLQKFLGFARSLPKGLEMKIGSQWWCLRRTTAESVLNYVEKNTKVEKFFRTVWIPDECFFQTLVGNLVPKNEINNHPPTYLKFSDYGMPVTFHADQADFLKQQNRFFARKITPHSEELANNLAEHFLSKDDVVKVNERGDSIYDFLVSSGRKGLRFEKRFWEDMQSIGRGKRLSVIICKDWQLGQRVADEAAKALGAKSLGYLFNEENSNLPDLGGIETSIEKRSRHRRVLMRLVFDFHETNHIVFCLDPVSKFILDDFYGDQCDVQSLYVGIDFDEDFSKGHAQRTGLLQEDVQINSSDIVKAVQVTLYGELAEIRSANFPQYYELDAKKTKRENADEFKKFLVLEKGDPNKILEATEYLN